MSSRDVEFARASGALAPLFVALNARGLVATMCGDFDATASLIAQKDIVNEVTGIQLAASCDLLLAGYRGRPAEAARLFAALPRTRWLAGRDSASRWPTGQKRCSATALGRYAEALAVAEPATEKLACLI